MKTQLLYSLFLWTLSFPLLTTSSIEQEEGYDDENSRFPPELIHRVPREFYTSVSTLINKQEDILKNYDRSKDSKPKLKDFVKNPNYSKYFHLTQSLTVNDIVGAVTFTWGTTFSSLDLEGWTRMQPDLDRRLRHLLMHGVDVDVNSDSDSSPNKGKKSGRAKENSRPDYVLTGIQHGLSFTILFRYQIHTGTDIPTPIPVENDNSIFCDEHCIANEKEKKEKNKEHENEETITKIRETVIEHLLKQMELLKSYPNASRQLFHTYFQENPNAPKFKLDMFGDIAAIPLELDSNSSSSNPYNNSNNSSHLHNSTKSSQNTTRETETEAETTGKTQFKTKDKDEIKDIYQILDFLDQVPQYLKTANKGQGYAVTFELESLEKILELHVQNKQKMEQGENHKNNNKIKNEEGKTGQHKLNQSFEHVQTIEI